MLGWFVGQVMKATGGKANPQAVNDDAEGKARHLDAPRFPACDNPAIGASEACLRWAKRAVAMREKRTRVAKIIFR